MTGVAQVAAVAEATVHYKKGEWSEGISLLRHELESEVDELVAARLKLAIVEGHNHQDWKNGLTHREEKRRLFAEVASTVTVSSPHALGAEFLYLQGMALHQEFIMGEPEPERELECFERSASLYHAAGDVASEAMATAMTGIYHHVDRLDRDAARPILQAAYDMASSPDARLARSEAARHLGQITQELGDPAAALPLLEESLCLREDDWVSYIPSALHAIASARLDSGDLDGAEVVLRRARSLAHDARFTLALIGLTEAALEFARLAPGVWQRSHP